MNYRVSPGLYAIGTPDADAPVVVSANYKLSFDALRRSLQGRNAWVLVLDTKGINVWCAAGKGTFGTDELVHRIQQTHLSELVHTRRLILPQLAGPGVQAHTVKKKTGFSVRYGPVDARDLPAYLDNGMSATPRMRSVRFSFIDRLVVTPLECIPALKKSWLPALVVLLFIGMERHGIMYGSLLSPGLAFILLWLLGIAAGAVMTPLLLPWIPVRSFALKGLLVAAVLFGGSYPILIGALGNNVFLAAAALVWFIALSSYLALLFTGTTPVTNISGVKKELDLAMPLYKTALIIGIVLLVLSKLPQLGVI
jgi:acetyl-CoA decarbonylase/synthase complex subunit gamma